MVPIKWSLNGPQCNSAGFGIAVLSVGFLFCRRVVFASEPAKSDMLVLTCRRTVTPRVNQRINRGVWRL